MSTPGGFVGRQRELRILGDRLAAARTGRPQVVFVEGEDEALLSYGSSISCSPER
jgi:hypothetical protein